jgi:hypothetical protein
MGGLKSAYTPNAGPLKMNNKATSIQAPPRTSGIPFKPREAAAKITPVQRSTQRVISIPTEAQTVEPKRIYKRVPTKGR